MWILQSRQLWMKNNDVQRDINCLRIPKHLSELKDRTLVTVIILISYEFRQGKSIWVHQQYLLGKLHPLSFWVRRHPQHLPPLRSRMEHKRLARTSSTPCWKVDSRARHQGTEDITAEREVTFPPSAHRSRRRHQRPYDSLLRAFR